MGKKIKRARKSRVAKRRKLKYKNIFIFLFVVLVMLVSIIYMLNLSISNIYIVNNKYLSDQEIIEYIKINNYPKSYSVPIFSLKKKLLRHPLVRNARITKKMFTSIHIEIEENYPLFYYEHLGKTLLLDGNLYVQKLNAPNVINYVPDTIYDLFVSKMAKIYPEILERMSEIKYVPNDVDEERFLILMKDNNYVYLTLSKFESINNYIDIVKKFGTKKGILYLDSGEYFEILKD